MAKVTTDEHLEHLSTEQLFRAHNGLEIETGKPLRGVGEAPNGCECEDCVSYRSGSAVAQAPKASGRSWKDVITGNK